MAHPAALTVRSAQCEYMKSPNGFRYTTGQKLAILADIDAGISLRQIASSHFCSLDTVQRIRDDQELRELQNPSIVSHRKKALSNMNRFVADRMLSSITDEDISKINAYQRVVASSIAIDKARLLDNESTQNVSVRGLEGTILEDLNKLKEEIEGL